LIERDLVFIGGGHTHALVLRMLAMKPIANVRLTLISDTILTPYSGMLPGYLAGHYSLDDTHLDLNKLCKAGNIRFIHDSVIGIDPDNKAIQLKHHSDIRFDKVSINTGSTPNLTIPGAKEFAVGVKPVSQLTHMWHQLKAQKPTTGAPHWAVVGAGAAGVEVVLAIAQYFKQKNTPIQLSLVHSGETILPSYHTRIKKRAYTALAEFNVKTVPHFKVTEVKADALIGETSNLAIDQSIWCTPAVAPVWPKESGLDVDYKGFIAVNPFLQSMSHPDVFAAGDVCAMTQSPRQKAGVFAVRSAPYLFKNLHAAFTQKTMQPANLQTDFLSLVSLGDKQAVGQRNGISFSGKWVWHWKDRIDRKFMELFSTKLPAMSASTDKMSMTNEPMHCAGCGSKLGPELLADTLKELADDQPQRAEDAAVAYQHNDTTLWQSIDGFRSFTDDYYNLGKVITHHAVNDCYAMGIAPSTAQVWANLAFSHARIARRDFKFLMSGIVNALNEHETKLIGGHSTEGMETHIGIVVNGEGRASWPKNGIREGDWLLLNKPLGSGIILAADMQSKVHANSIECLWHHLLESNRAYFQSIKRLDIHAATDVTGFGLVGHLLEMTDETNLSIELKADEVPLMQGVLELSQQGYASSLLPQLLPLKNRCRIQLENEPLVNCLFDPQTQGGLLISVSPAIGKTIIENQWATKIGLVTAQQNESIIIT
jgi:selenide,water dikinase